ncbi:MAG: helix-turn-helix domain-containing protein [Geminicoccaceae bacterium]
MAVRLVPRPRKYDLEAGGKLIPLRPSEAVLMSRLMGAKGFVTMNDLIDALYGMEPDGGPLTADECVRVNMSRIRRKLGGTGVRIVGRSWHGYMIEDAAQ